ncbi:hypothetical protein [Streptomyces hainanensis]|uniref:Uncharacterized protein n=1 Tax=Streptomyces hainanensis TaxID=402648 RepID=A0A4R4TDG8_9ACTN|nr:hypothetical protein [Streptomyces hainanensis]TDC72369.1 hypothetical protein E1283_21905 [Streptomyces hainanensis]
MRDDDEPVFRRSRWGTSAYVYNHRNPVGRFLIVLSLVLVAVGLVLMVTGTGPFAPAEPVPTAP